MQPPKNKKVRIKREETENQMEFVEKILQAAPTNPENDDVNKILKGEDETIGVKPTDASEESVANREKSVSDLVSEIIQGAPETEEEIDPEFLSDFLVETAEHLENIEIKVLALETDPGNNELINDLFRSFHTIKGLAGFVNQNTVRIIAHQTETRLDKCRKGEHKVSKHFVDLILASADFLKRICQDLKLSYDAVFLKMVQEHLEALNKELEPNENWEHKVTSKNPDYQAVKVDKLGEILVTEGVPPETVEELLTKKEEYPDLKLGQIAVKEKKAEAREVIKSLRIQEKATNLVSSENGLSGYTRVPTAKIDSLVDMIGELTIIQSVIEREAAKHFDSNNNLMTNLSRMEKITKSAQDVSMSLRMVSLKSTFQKINRIARDTIAELGRNINFNLEGEETEIDRGITEKIFDPLLHLVKNAISHGIETEEERVALGKPAQGKVLISAYGKRGSVYIEIYDDGRGLPLEKIRQKALDKNFIDPNRTYTDEEIMDLIFLPGLSTAENVNNISGRGVGMDVVKTEISKIGGRVEIASRTGEGSTFTLKIPINLAAVNGMIVDISGTQYIIPTLGIKQIVKAEEAQWINISGNRSMIRVRDELIPVIPIAKIFDLPETEENQEGLFLVLEQEQVYRALPVRKILERREVVIKSVGSEFSHLPFVAGASILGDGRVSIILDIEHLFKMGDGSGKKEKAEIAG